MSQSIATYLMYQDGAAEDAVNYYVSQLEDARIDKIERWGEGEHGPAGKIKLCHFTLCGRAFIAIDSPPVHEFGFTPSISLFVDVESEAQIDALFAIFSDGGKVMMPLDNYGFSKKFAWVEDRFGVSWQFNLPA
ncbi:MAG: VOC family protein [Pseudomonadota bacterium]